MYCKIGGKELGNRAFLEPCCLPRRDSVLFIVVSLVSGEESRGEDLNIELAQSYASTSASNQIDVAWRATVRS